MYILGVVTSLSLAAIGNFSVLLAQAAATSGTDPTIAVLSAGGSISAVGGLVYIAKKFADGSLVAREPAQTERVLIAMNEKLIELLQESQRREDREHERERSTMEWLAQETGRDRPERDKIRPTDKK